MNSKTQSSTEAMIAATAMSVPLPASSLKRSCTSGCPVDLTSTRVQTESARESSPVDITSRLSGSSSGFGTGVSMRQGLGHNFGRVSVYPKPTERLQTKLRVGDPGDKYEQEADRVANMVMRMPEVYTQHRLEEQEKNQGESLIQRQEEEEEEEEELIQASRH